MVGENNVAVLLFQVIGVPDERLGEKVCACIRRKVGSNLTEEELKKFCMGKVKKFFHQCGLFAPVVGCCAYYYILFRLQILKFLNMSGFSIRFQERHQEKYKNTSYEIKPWLTSN